MEISNKLPERKPNRLYDYDYSLENLYFVTICCDNNKCRFGHIKDGTMILNRIGAIAQQELELLSQRFTNIELDIFQIMPNHIHAIVIIKEQKLQINLGRIIGAYKSLVATKSLPLFIEKNEQMGKFWQRSYYDHIIRNYKSYRNISNYIVENPIHWVNDELYTAT